MILYLSAQHVVSPTECLLTYLELPDDDEMSVDLEQAAVIILAHLDRLANPHLPPQHSTSGRHHQGQEVHKFDIQSFCGNCNMKFAVIIFLKIYFMN